MLAVKTHAYFFYSFPKVLTTEGQFADVFLPSQAFKGKYFSLKMGRTGHQHLERSTNRAIQAVSSGVNDNKVSSSSIEDFNVTTTFADKDDKLKITVEVSGTKTQEIYDEVFSKMVDDAQPIRGFRRVKGGKTPNIPKDILLEILGPSNVYEQVIRRVINGAIAEYVAKEGLKVGKDLEIEQSLEDLEAVFKPGGKFRFDAIVQCNNLKRNVLMIHEMDAEGTDEEFRFKKLKYLQNEM